MSRRIRQAVGVVLMLLGAASALNAVGGAPVEMATQIVIAVVVVWAGYNMTGLAGFRGRSA